MSMSMAGYSVELGNTTGLWDLNGNATRERCFILAGLSGWWKRCQREATKARGYHGFAGGMWAAGHI